MKLFLDDKLDPEHDDPSNCDELYDNKFNLFMSDSVDNIWDFARGKGCTEEPLPTAFEFNVQCADCHKRRVFEFFLYTIRDVEFRFEVRAFPECIWF